MDRTGSNTVETKQRRPGQGLVEFVIVVPLLLGLLSGSFDAGRILFAYHDLQTSVSAGASFAQSHPGDRDGIKQAVLASGAQDVAVRSTVRGSCDPNGDGTIDVIANQEITPLFAGTIHDAATALGFDLDWSIQVSAESKKSCGGS